MYFSPETKSCSRQNYVELLLLRKSGDRLPPVLIIFLENSSGFKMISSLFLNTLKESGLNSLKIVFRTSLRLNLFILLEVEVLFEEKLLIRVFEIILRCLKFLINGYQY